MFLSAPFHNDALERVPPLRSILRNQINCGTISLNFIVLSQPISPREIVFQIPENGKVKKVDSGEEWTGRDTFQILINRHRDILRKG
jgi:hypothetical protein